VLQAVKRLFKIDGFRKHGCGHTSYQQRNIVMKYSTAQYHCAPLNLSTSIIYKCKRDYTMTITRRNSLRAVQCRIQLPPASIALQ